jgi:hypothetical protein
MTADAILWFFVEDVPDAGINSPVALGTRTAPS